MTHTVFINMLIFLILGSVSIGKLNAVVYDVYLGKPATESRLRFYEERNNSEYCAINIKPCDANEWRRIDGSCNNLKHPSIGAPRTPYVKLLDTEFSVDYEPRNAKFGKPLPLARYLRTELLQEGKANDLKITQLVAYYLVFGAADLVSTHDIMNYLGNTTTCCTPAGKFNYACTPVKIPEYDPVHRYSGINCQNLTRPQSFQYFGCADFGSTTFARIVYTTPVFDLSAIYNFKPGSIDQIRSFKEGLLKYDHKTFEKSGQIFPVGNHTEAYNRLNCGLNDYPKESLCYNHISDISALLQADEIVPKYRKLKSIEHDPNAILPPNILIILFYRQHNKIAKQLQEMNPCWDDDRLFYTARDINIAIYVHIYITELLPVLLGRKNMQREGIISCSDGFRDLYDENVLPQVSDEFIYGNRYFHTIQEANVDFYDIDGAYLKTLPIVNLTRKHGYLAADDNLNGIYRGSYRQASGAFDNTIDYDIAERIQGGMQLISDVATNDLYKGRFFGFPSYIKYRKLCSGKTYKCFNDLKDVMSDERIYRLKQVYRNIEDVELMAGLWSERIMPGTRVPYTLYCIMVEQLKRTVVSDRHWYQRRNRPHAFTKEQLQAIYKVTIAGVLCGNADIGKIQPRAFYSINKKHNPLVECSSVGNLDISPWEDPECKKNQQKYYNRTCQ